jgi:hypothetical protein
MRAEWLLQVHYPEPRDQVGDGPAHLVSCLLARNREQARRQGLVPPRLVEIMQNWVHPGFSLFQGERIDPDDHEARRRLAGYMVHSPIALERVRYRPETGQVICYGRALSR